MASSTGTPFRDDTYAVKLASDQRDRAFMRTAPATQFNLTQIEYNDEGAFTSPAERLMDPCAAGRSGGCGGTRLPLNEGGAVNTKLGVQATFPGSLPYLETQRADFKAFIIGGQMRANAAFQLVSQQSPDASLDGSTDFCMRRCKQSGADQDVDCGWCSAPSIARRDPGDFMYPKAAQVQRAMAADYSFYE